MSRPPSSAVPRRATSDHPNAGTSSTKPGHDECLQFAKNLVSGVPATTPSRSTNGDPADLAEFLVRWNLQWPVPDSRRVETIMLRGDPGTGKTRFARLMWIHRAWCWAPPKLRREADEELKQFLIEHRDPLNMTRSRIGLQLVNYHGWKEAPLPNVVGSLFDSLLFGYTAGSFSGANKQDTPGVLTWPNQKPWHKDVFLDEVTEIAGDLQPKLLGILSTGEFTPVGGKVSHQLVDRLILASNRDLKQVAGTTLRRDLYERIATPCIRIGGVSEYPQKSFEMLVRSLVTQISRDLDIEGKHIHLQDSEIDELFQLSWPGNVRQLEKVLEDFVRACVSGKTGRRPSDVAEEIAPLFGAPDNAPQPEADVDRMAREFCEQEFRRVVSQQEPGLTPSMLFKRLADAKLPQKHVLSVFQDVYRGWQWGEQGATPCVNHGEWQKYRHSRNRE